MPNITTISELRKIHEERFIDVNNWSEHFYEDYENRKKIIFLLDYWLYSLRSFIECYGLDALRGLKDTKSKCFIRFSWKVEHNVDTTTKDISRYKFHFLYNLLSYFSINLFLAGSDVRSLKRKCLLRYTKLLLQNFPISLDRNRQKILLEKITQYFDDILQLEDSEWFTDVIPEIFYSNQVRIWRSKQINIESAPSEFLEFKGYERIFLNNVPVHVIGRQHGGGYDAYKAECLTEYSKKLSDVYIGWGLSDLNLRQHKYYYKSELGTHTESRKRVIWVERGRLPKFFPYLWHEYDTEPIHYIAKELSRTKINYYNIPYPPPFGKSQLYDEFRKNTLGINGKNAENIINMSDIVIFDTCTATVMHFCLEHQILFLLITSRESLKKFTSKQAEWFQMLKAHGLGFFDDEIGFLEKKICEILKPTYRVPSQVKQYHYDHFINI